MQATAKHSTFTSRATWRVRLLVPALVLPLLLSGNARIGRCDDLPKMTLKTENFDRDPNWDGLHNRIGVAKTVTIKQDFGYSKTAHAGGGAGEIGGLVSPAAEPAYYGKVIPATTLNEPLSASGTISVPKGGGNTLVGFFNSESLNEWRTPSSIALRINGRGETFHIHLEYTTQRWRAGAYFYSVRDSKTGKDRIRDFASGTEPHTWSLKYDPQGNGGKGSITALFDNEPLVVNLDEGHKADGATFNRFGILNVMKSADGGGSLWLDDLTINGTLESFDRDPEWEAKGNRARFATENIRPRFNFGYSATHFAGGKTPGELGGLIVRGDEHYPERMAYYGDRLENMTFEHPLRASGKVCQTRGVTDSTVLIGFFHSADTMRHSTSQSSGFPENFLGAAIEGPSREGFYFYPVYATDTEGTTGYSNSNDRPHIHPDGKPHDWTLEYSPTGANGQGQITVSLDGKKVTLDLAAGHKAIGGRFNRFGIVTTHIDGNGQKVYFDDLTYTTGFEKTNRN